MSKMPTLNLGCPVERVACNFYSQTLDLHVPANCAPDMGQALEYALRVNPDVITVNVFEAPGDHLALVYRWDHIKRDWVAFVPQNV